LELKGLVGEVVVGVVDDLLWPLEPCPAEVKEGGTLGQSHTSVQLAKRMRRDVTYIGTAKP